MATKRARDLRRAQVHAALVALVCALLASSQHPAGTAYNDSASYIDGALHLSRGQGFNSIRTAVLSTTPHPITLWPPGFSAALVPGLWLGLSALESAAWVLGASYVLCGVSLFWATLSLGTLRSVWLGWCVVLSFVLQPLVLHAVDVVMSDLLFTAVMLAALAVALHAMRTRRAVPGWCAVLGALLGYGVLVRYAGLFIVPAVLFATWLGLRRPRRLGRRTLAFVPAVVAFVPLAVWWPVRNELVGGRPLGTRNVVPRDFVEQAQAAVAGLAGWASEAHDVLSSALLADGFELVVGASCALIVALVLRQRAWRRRGARTLWLAALSYTVLMVTAATLHSFDPLDDKRFWLPVWSLGSLLWASAVLGARRDFRWIRSTLYAALAVSIALFALGFVRGLPRVREPGGLLVDSWRRAAEALPDPSSCRLMITDARPFMLHRDLGLTSYIPRTLSDLEKAKKTHGKLCLAVVRARRPPPSVQRVLASENALIAQLQAAGRLRRLSRVPPVTVYAVE